MSKTVYIKIGLTGGGAGDLDGIDGNDLLDGDICFVLETGTQYANYVLDDDLGAGEDSPDIIVPDTNPGTKCWVLQGLLPEKFNLGDGRLEKDASDNMWLTANAYFDGTDWQRIDIVEEAFGVQLISSGNIPNESMPGVCVWRCQPAANPIGSNWGAVGSWENAGLITYYGDLVLGGTTVEMDGHGTMPYGRTLHCTYDGSVYTALAKNVYGGMTGVDDNAEPSWFSGFDDDAYKIMRAPAGGLVWDTFLNIMDSGNLSLTNDASIDAVDATSGTTKVDSPILSFKSSVWGGDISTPVVSPASPVITVTVLHHDEMTVACTGFQVKWTNGTSTWSIESGAAQYPNATVTGTANYFKLDLDGVLFSTPYGDFYPKDIYGVAASGLSVDTTITFNIIPQAIDTEFKIGSEPEDENQPNLGLPIYINGTKMAEFKVRDVPSDAFTEPSHGLFLYGGTRSQNDDYPHSAGYPAILWLYAKNEVNFADLTYDGSACDIDVVYGPMNIRSIISDANRIGELRVWNNWDISKVRIGTQSFGGSFDLYPSGNYGVLTTTNLSNGLHVSNNKVLLENIDQGAATRQLWIRNIQGASKVAICAGATTKGFQIFEDYWGTVEEGVNFQVRTTGTDIDDNWATAALIEYGGDIEIKNDFTLENGVLTLFETTTPSAVADYGKVYTKNDNKLYFQDGAGVEHEIAFV